MEKEKSTWNRAGEEKKNAKQTAYAGQELMATWSQDVWIQQQQPGMEQPMETI